MGKSKNQITWEVTGQIASVERGQKKDKVKFGKGEMVSTICMDADTAGRLKYGEKLRVTLEIDPSLDFGDDD